MYMKGKGSLLFLSPNLSRLCQIKCYLCRSHTPTHKTLDFQDTKVRVHLLNVLSVDPQACRQ